MKTCCFRALFFSSLLVISPVVFSSNSATCPNPLNPGQECSIDQSLLEYNQTFVFRDGVQIYGKQYSSTTDKNGITHDAYTLYAPVTVTCYDQTGNVRETKTISPDYTYNQQSQLNASTNGMLCSKGGYNNNKLYYTQKITITGGAIPTPPSHESSITVTTQPADVISFQYDVAPVYATSAEFLSNIGKFK